MQKKIKKRNKDCERIVKRERDVRRKEEGGKIKGVEYSKEKKDKNE